MNILGSFTIPVTQVERTFEECDRLKDTWTGATQQSLMAHSLRTGQGQGTENNGFLYYAMYCTDYTGTGTGNHCFLLYPSRSLSLSRSWSSAVCISHYSVWVCQQCETHKRVLLHGQHWVFNSWSPHDLTNAGELEPAGSQLVTSCL